GADVCDLGGGLNSSGQCTLTANALYDYTAFNSTGAINPTTTKQEHFIVNSSESQIINGTPYGNAGRNSLRDYWTNVANFQITKTSNWGERVRLVWHMSAVNVFNHANYASIDPFLEDAGLVGLGTGFANP